MEKPPTKGNYSTGRNYGAERKMGRIGGFARKFGTEMGKMGKETFRGGPSLEQRMEKLGFGKKTYRHYGRGRWSRPGGDVAKWLGLSKGSYWKRKTVQQEAKNLDQKGESSKRQQVVDAEIEEAERELGEDPKVAKMWVDKVVKNLRAGGRFAGGRRVPKEQVGKIVRGTSGIPGEVKEYLASVFEGKEQHQERTEDKGTTQGEMAGKLKELAERGVLKESDVIEAERRLGVENTSSGQMKQPSAPASRSRWKVSAFTGWGKRQKADTNNK